MANPLSIDLAEVLLQRLRRISKADGYNTDAGQHVYFGPYSASGLARAIVLQASEERVQSGGSNNRSFTLQRTLKVSGFIKADPKCEKGRDLEYLLADTKRALFLWQPPENLRTVGTAMTYVSTDLAPRKDGNEFESFDITFTLTYQEAHGDPYAVR